MATINIGGKDREFDFSHTGFVIAAEKHDTEILASYLQRDHEADDPPVAMWLPRLTWIGLLPADPELSEATVREWFMGDVDYEALLDTIEVGTTKIDDMTSRLSKIFDSPKKQVPYRSPERAARKERQRRKKGRK